MVPVSTSSGPGPFTAHDRHWEGNAIIPAPLAQTAGASLEVPHLDSSLLQALIPFYKMETDIIEGI